MADNRRKLRFCRSAKRERSPGIRQQENCVERGDEGHDGSREKNVSGLKVGERGERKIETCGEKHADEGKQIRGRDNSALLLPLGPMLDQRVERDSIKAAEKSKQTKIDSHRPDAQARPRNQKSEQRHSDSANWN